MKPADIHRQLLEMYGEHALSDSVVRRWVGHFKEGRENVHGDTFWITYVSRNIVVELITGYIIFVHKQGNTK
jgi:hypothetical protein